MRRAMSFRHSSPSCRSTRPITGPRYTDCRFPPWHSHPQPPPQIRRLCLTRIRMVARVLTARVRASTPVLTTRSPPILTVKVSVATRGNQNPRHIRNTSPRAAPLNDGSSTVSHVDDSGRVSKSAPKPKRMNKNWTPQGGDRK